MNKSRKSSIVKSADHEGKKRDRLAEAFPLLFGKTAEERSTIGKYTSKDKDKGKRRQSTIIQGDENSAPSNTHEVVVEDNKASKRSSFLSNLKRKNQPPKPHKTICITSPQPRGVELIEEKKKPQPIAEQSRIPEISEASPVDDGRANLTNDFGVTEQQNFEEINPLRTLLSPTRLVQKTEDHLQKEAVDDSTMISALRNFITTMESNDDEQHKNESNFQLIDSTSCPVAFEEPIVNDIIINEYVTLESEIKNAGDEKGMVIIPDGNIDSRRSSASSYASLTSNSQRTSLCTEAIPLADEYVSHTMGDRDVVPARVSGGKTEKILVHPRFALMNEAMISGLIIAEVVNRLQFENHIKFMITVEVLPIPTISEPYMNIRIMLMKRLSEFKALRQSLLGVLKPNSEGIPPLPTRQVLSMGSDYAEKDYLESRQRYLRNWMNSIMVRQSVEGDDFRKILINFLSN